MSWWTEWAKQGKGRQVDSSKQREWFIRCQLAQPYLHLRWSLEARHAQSPSFTLISRWRPCPTYRDFTGFASIRQRLVTMQERWTLQVKMWRQCWSDTTEHEWDWVILNCDFESGSQDGKHKSNVEFKLVWTCQFATLWRQTNPRTRYFHWHLAWPSAEEERMWYFAALWLSQHGLTSWHIRVILLQTFNSRITTQVNQSHSFINPVFITRKKGWPEGRC